MNEADFIQLLKSAQGTLQRQKIEEFRRRVGFGDLVTERAENAREYGFGDGTTCYDGAVILGDVTVGERCWIGPNSILDGTGGLTIGDWVTVSFGAMIASHSTLAHMLSAGRQPIVRRRTVIGSRVVIGPGSFIGMGVHVGDRCVIAPHAVVSRNVPSNVIVQGDPARVIGRVVFDENEVPHLLLDRGAARRARPSDHA